MSSVLEHPRRRDVQVISVIGVAHGLSHFLQLAMPAVFLAIRRDWDISFAGLGLAATVFYLVSGLCQTFAGFAVDRFGAVPVLITGIALLSGAIGLMGVAPNLEFLILCSALGGVGNSMFHPADYGVLNARVSPARLGPAFSVHGITGNIGWALAPPVMTAMSAWFGGWRGALTGAAGIGFIVLTLVIVRRHMLEPEAPVRPLKGDAIPVRAGAAVLLSTPILMCFGFFLLLAAGLIGIQTFGIPTLNQTYHLSAQVAAVTLTSFLLASGAGVLCGGVVAAHTQHHEHVAAAGMAAAAAFVALVAAVSLPAWAILGALAAAGFCSGLTNPSRDLLVRAAAPKGSTGKVYGFVYSGLDAGSALAPSLFGWLLDHDRGTGVIYAVSALWLASIATIYYLKSATRTASAA